MRPAYPPTIEQASRLVKKGGTETLSGSCIFFSLIRKNAEISLQNGEKRSTGEESHDQP